MLTKKQQWRRTKSNKYSFPDGTPLGGSFGESRKGDAIEGGVAFSPRTINLCKERLDIGIDSPINYNELLTDYSSIKTEPILYFKNKQISNSDDDIIKDRIKHKVRFSNVVKVILYR